MAVFQLPAHFFLNGRCGQSSFDPYFPKQKSKTIFKILCYTVLVTREEENNMLGSARVKTPQQFSEKCDFTINLHWIEDTVVVW